MAVQVVDAGLVLIRLRDVSLMPNVNRNSDRRVPVNRRNAQGQTRSNGSNVHDLRRSAATSWTELLDADPLLADRMIAHKPSRLVGTYNLAERYELQCETWEQWGELVDRGAELRYPLAEIKTNLPYKEEAFFEEPACRHLHLYEECLDQPAY